MTSDLQSLSPEFFFAEGEPYDTSELALKNGRPVSLYSAILMMPLKAFRAACRANRLSPMFTSAEVLLNKARQHDTCTDIGTPAEVWLDREGYHRVKVW